MIPLLPFPFEHAEGREAPDLVVSVFSPRFSSLASCRRRGGSEAGGASMNNGLPTLAPGRRGVVDAKGEACGV